MKFEGSSEQREGAPQIQLKDEWKDVFNKLTHDYFPEEIPSPNELVDLRIGKTRVYIRRRDVVDAHLSTYHPILKQVARLKIENQNIVGIEIVDPALAADTFYKLSSDPYFKSIIDHFKVNTSVSLEGRVVIANKGKMEKSKLDQKMATRDWLLQKSQEATARRSLNLTEIQDDAIDVYIDEIRHIDETSAKRYITTLGAGPCIIVAGYHPDSHTAVITHMNDFTKIEEKINKLCEQLKLSPVYVFGGDMSSLNELLKLKELLDSRGITVKEWDVLNSVKRIAIDKETGEFFNISLR